MLWLTHDTARLNPFDVVNRIASGELQEKEWKKMIASCGVDPSMPLAPPKRSSAGSHANEEAARHALPVCPSAELRTIPRIMVQTPKEFSVQVVMPSYQNWKMDEVIETDDLAPGGFLQVQAYSIDWLQVRLFARACRS